MLRLPIRTGLNICGSAVSGMREGSGGKGRGTCGFDLFGEAAGGLVGISFSFYQCVDYYPQRNAVHLGDYYLHPES